MLSGKEGEEQKGYIRSGLRCISRCHSATWQGGALVGPVGEPHPEWELDIGSSLSLSAVMVRKSLAI